MLQLVHKYEYSIIHLNETLINLIYKNRQYPFQVFNSDGAMLYLYIPKLA